MGFQASPAHQRVWPASIFHPDWCENLACPLAQKVCRFTPVPTHDSIGTGEDGPTHQLIEQSVRREKHLKLRGGGHI